jgi:hypothetical protein
MTYLPGGWSILTAQDTNTKLHNAILHSAIYESSRLLMRPWPWQCRTNKLTYLGQNNSMDVSSKETLPKDVFNS